MFCTSCCLGGRTCSYRGFEYRPEGLNNWKRNNPSCNQNTSIYFIFRFWRHSGDLTTWKLRVWIFESTEFLLWLDVLLKKLNFNKFQRFNSLFCLVPRYLKRDPFRRIYKKKKNVITGWEMIVFVCAGNHFSSTFLFYFLLFFLI